MSSGLGHVSGGQDGQGSVFAGAARKHIGDPCATEFHAKRLRLDHLCAGVLHADRISGCVDVKADDDSDLVLINGCDGVVPVVGPPPSSADNLHVFDTTLNAWVAATSSDLCGPEGRLNLALADVAALDVPGLDPDPLVGLLTNSLVAFDAGADLSLCGLANTNVFTAVNVGAGLAYGLRANVNVCVRLHALLPLLLPSSVFVPIGERPTFLRVFVGTETTIGTVVGTSERNYTIPLLEPVNITNSLNLVVSLDAGEVLRVGTALRDGVLLSSLGLHGKLVLHATLL